MFRADKKWNIMILRSFPKSFYYTSNMKDVSHFSGQIIDLPSPASSLATSHNKAPVNKQP
jgi:hypothetical protein